MCLYSLALTSIRSSLVRGSPEIGSVPFSSVIVHQLSVQIPRPPQMSSPQLTNVPLDQRLLVDRARGLGDDGRRRRRAGNCGARVSHRNTSGKRQENSLAQKNMIALAFLVGCSCTTRADGTREDAEMGMEGRWPYGDCSVIACYCTRVFFKRGHIYQPPITQVEASCQNDTSGYFEPRSRADRSLMLATQQSNLLQLHASPQLATSSAVQRAVCRTTGTTSV